jgi:hypothetical protein
MDRRTYDVRCISHARRTYDVRCTSHARKTYDVRCLPYRDEGVCPIAGNHLVSPDPTHHFTHQSKFIPLLWCYQQPVALWPYDPKGKLQDGDRRKAFFTVIDRNEDQEAD